jgi:hypothetical protein
MSGEHKKEFTSGSNSGITRRQAIVLMSLTGFAALLNYVPTAWADDKKHALYGNWHVRCPLSHIDLVTGGTRQHRCETCGRQCFVDGKVTVMCPKGHANIVVLGNVDLLTSYKCQTKDCGLECQGW